jgi:hypothetical protein
MQANCSGCSMPPPPATLREQAPSAGLAPKVGLPALTCSLLALVAQAGSLWHSDGVFLTGAHNLDPCSPHAILVGRCSQPLQPVSLRQIVAWCRRVG